MKAAVVTGASRGIGRGIALALAAAGYDLAITYSTGMEEANKVAARITEELGRRCFVLQANLEEADAPKRVISSAAEHLDRIDVVVNNAGYTKFDGDLGDDVEAVSRLMHVDFRAYYLVAVAAAEDMRAKRIRGSVIQVTSSRAERAYPDDAVYGGMKAAVRRATESLAVRYGPYGIRVNCVAPGATVVHDSPPAREFYSSLAPKIPLGRIGTPEDIGNAVVWLASEKASYITGVTLRVDGGLILPGMPERPGADLSRGWSSYLGEKGVNTP